MFILERLTLYPSGIWSHLWLGGQIWHSFSSFSSFHVPQLAGVADYLEYTPCRPRQLTIFIASLASSIVDVDDYFVVESIPLGVRSSRRESDGVRPKTLPRDKLRR